VTDRPKRPLDEIHRRVDEMFAALMEELDRIDAERDAKRAAAIARSGLPVELIEAASNGSESRVAGFPGPLHGPPPSQKSPLTQDASYATIATMSTNFVPEPRKPGRPLGAGPVAKAAKKLRMSMVGLAEAIGCNENTVKAWNARNAIPADAQAKIDALLAKAKRDASK
jgi:DNA-binding transcriptional regulator YiaG